MMRDNSTAALVASVCHNANGLSFILLTNAILFNDNPCTGTCRGSLLSEMEQAPSCEETNSRITEAAFNN